MGVQGAIVCTRGAGMSVMVGGGSGSMRSHCGATPVMALLSLAGPDRFDPLDVLLPETEALRPSPSTR